MTVLRFLFWSLLCLVMLGCGQTEQSFSVGAWRASNDYGDKPGNGFELRITDQGKMEGRFYLLQPEKPHEFSQGASIPLKIERYGRNEMLFSLDFGAGQIEKMKLTFPQGVRGQSFDGFLQHQGGGDEPIKFVFRKQ